MAETKLFRAEYSDRNAATQSFQCRDEVRELSDCVPRDVFTEETASPAGIEAFDDAIGEPSVICLAKPLSGDAVSLARVSRHEAIHRATPCSSIEGSQVRPDRRRMKPPFFHARDQNGCGMGFPLHVADGASRWLGELYTEVEPSDACADGDEVPGT